MKRLTALLLGGLLTLLSLDALLYWVDPLGLTAQSYSLNQLALLRQLHDTGFVLPDGTHDFYAYTATIVNGWRRVPDTNNDADCTIAFIGDSLTFGTGVTDEETFVNQLALRFPDTRFINVARHGYNIGNISALYETVVADGYVWLLIDNDALPDATSPPVRTGSNIPATAIYLLWIVRGAPPQPQPDYPHFFAGLPMLMQEDVLIAGFQHHPLAIAVQSQFPIVLLPPYTYQVSWIDAHPDKRGHQQIAAGLHPALAYFVEGRCHARS